MSSDAPDASPSITTQTCLVPPDGAASVSMPGMPKIKDPVPDPKRQMSFDLTGFYESVPPSTDMNSSRLLQLNQAGQVLVGWMTPPPAFVRPWVPFSVSAAVFVVDLSVRGGKGYRFWYLEFDHIDGHDPSEVLDPYSPWGYMDEGWSGLDGYLDYRDDGASVTLAFRLKDNSEARLDFTRQSKAARASERTIGAQAEPMKTALIVRHRRPLPGSFFDTTRLSAHLWADALALFSGDPGGKLARAIHDYMTNLAQAPKLLGVTIGPQVDPNHSAREVARAQMEDMLTFSWLVEPYEKLFRLRLSALARDTKLTLSDCPAPTTRSYRDWMSAIAVNEMKNSLDFAEEHGKDYQAVPKGFARLTAGTRIYRYELAFSKLQDKGKDFTDEESGIAAFHGAVAVFTVTIAQKYFDLAADGTLPADSEWKATDKRPAQYFGFLFEFKVGADGPPDLPDMVAMHSGEDLKQDDFEASLFEVYALDASVKDSAAVKNFGMSFGVKSSSGGDSGLLRIHMLKHDPIEGAYAAGHFKPDLKFSAGKNIDVEAIKRIANKHDIAKDSDFFSIDINLKKNFKFSAGVSVGFGVIGSQVKLSDWLKPASRVESKTLVGGDGRTIAVQFEKNKAELNLPVNGWSPRTLLESVLAIDLVLLNGAPLIDVVGSASPEYTPQYNLILSQKRALAIKYAINDAVGPLSDDVITACGSGDAEARSAGLTEPDPTGDPSARARFLAAPHSEKEMAQWPQYRKADVDIRGRFAMRVLALSDDEDTAS